jgi:hypothetical protein
LLSTNVRKLVKKDEICYAKPAVYVNLKLLKNYASAVNASDLGNFIVL